MQFCVRVPQVVQPIQSLFILYCKFVFEDAWHISNGISLILLQILNTVWLFGLILTLKIPNLISAIFDS